MKAEAAPNRTFQFITYVFFISILLCFFYIFFGGSILNDLKAHRIEKDFSKMTLPADTEFVEVSSYVGNTSGAGNLTEIWVGILIHTDLDEETVRDRFKDFDVLSVPDDLKKRPDYIHFQSLNEDVPVHGYYVIGKYFDAFTQMDLRGH